MGVSYSAWTVPGRTISSSVGPAAAIATATVGIASASVACASFASACCRLSIPDAATPTANAAPHNRSIRVLSGREVCRSWVTVMSPMREGSRSTDQLVRRGTAPSAVDEGEHSRHKNQGCDRCEEQTANNSPAKWRVLLAAFAKAQGHRYHADDHGERRHQHGAEAGKAGLERRSLGIDARLPHPVARETHNQDAIRRGDANAHDGPGQCR